MLRLLLTLQSRHFVEYFRTKTIAKSVTALLFFVVIGVVCSGIYVLLRSGLLYIKIEAGQELQAALFLFLYESFFITLSIITAFSSILIVLFTLFRGPVYGWILSSPSYYKLPIIVIIEHISKALLPASCVLIPALFAYIRTFSLNIGSFILVVTSSYLYLTMIVILSTVTVLVVGILVQKLVRDSLTFGKIAITVMITSLLVIYASYTTIANVDVVTLFRADTISGEVLDHSYIADHFRFSPAHPVAMELMLLQEKNYPSILLQLLLLLCYFVGTLLAIRYTTKFFYPLWQKLQEHTLVKQEERQFGPTFLFQKSSVHALLEKETLATLRNWKGLLWTLFLVSIWLLQVATSMFVAHHKTKYHADIPDKEILLMSLECMIIIYFMSAFALRFAFTAFSTEKTSAWILISAPINKGTFFLTKSFFFLTSLSLLGFGMTLVSFLTIRQASFDLLGILLLIVSIVISITIWALVLGALFPNKESDDPEVISTSLPGLFFTLLALSYGGICSYLLFINTINQTGLAYLLAGTTSVAGISSIVTIINAKRIAREIF